MKAACAGPFVWWTAWPGDGWKEGEKVLIDGVESYLYCYGLESANLYWVRVSLSVQLSRRRKSCWKQTATSYRTPKSSLFLCESCWNDNSIYGIVKETVQIGPELRKELPSFSFYSSWYGCELQETNIEGSNIQWQTCCWKIFSPEKTICGTEGHIQTTKSRIGSRVCSSMPQRETRCWWCTLFSLSNFK